jgi:hypothetical protein
VPNTPPPDPSVPPTATYTSTCGANFSSWDGSFTYNNTDKVIDYTRTNPSQTYSTTNKDSGNAIRFELIDVSITPNVTVEFKGPNFKWEGPDNKAEYKGTCTTKAPVADPDSWTATQTS